MTKKERKEKKIRIDTIRRNRKASGRSTKKCVVDLMESLNQTMSIENIIYSFEKHGYRVELNDGLRIY